MLLLLQYVAASLVPAGVRPQKCATGATGNISCLHAQFVAAVGTDDFLSPGVISSSVI